jgi:hypothetical protein
MKYPYWMAVKNVGHAIMRNALIATGKADMYAYFDADDVMFPDYLMKNININVLNSIVLHIYIIYFLFYNIP